MGMHIIFFISPHYLILCILFALCEQILYRHTCAIISYIASLILSDSKCPCRIFLTYLQDCQVKIGVKTKYTEKQIELLCMLFVSRFASSMNKTEIFMSTILLSEFSRLRNTNQSCNEYGCVYVSVFVFVRGKVKGKVLQSFHLTRI